MEGGKGKLPTQPLNSAHSFFMSGSPRKLLNSNKDDAIKMTNETSRSEESFDLQEELKALQADLLELMQQIEKKIT